MSESLIALSLLFVASGATAFFSTGLVTRAAEQIGLVYRPDERKLHTTATPRLGGLAIIFAFAFPLLLTSANSHAQALVSKNLS
jgi:UDP-N-acetylmuramyl pentapeptide phosphotransferase/UDP-N-acetylglucosamine-1-phosphate transferase